MVAQMPHWGGKRIPQHWVQLRRSLCLHPSDVNIDLEVQSRMRTRYVCVTMAFKNLDKERRNIYQLNYIIGRLLKMESPAEYALFAKFLPLSKTPKQPDADNERWEKIMRWCRKRFPKTNWPFEPVSEEEMENTFSFFR